MLPAHINLIVAVSFGLLVPARILEAAQFGGINVHPSLLPDLRGPSPIQYALLRRRQHTGVTVQTMHPTKFDHGEILHQTPAPGIALAGHDMHTLLDTLAKEGAKLLCDVVSRLPEVNPHTNVTPSIVEHAPRITPEDRHIDWQVWTSDEIQLRDSVLGDLWDTTTYTRCQTGDVASKEKRIKFQGPWKILAEPHSFRDPAEDPCRERPGAPVVLLDDEGHKKLLGIKTVDNRLAIPAAAIIDGGTRDQGMRRLIRMLESS